MLENFEHLAPAINGSITQTFHKTLEFSITFTSAFMGSPPPPQDMVAGWNFKQLCGGGHAMGEREL